MCSRRASNARTATASSIPTKMSTVLIMERAHFSAEISWRKEKARELRRQDSEDGNDEEDDCSQK